MDNAITATVTKTLQERQYEPYTVSLTWTQNPDNGSAQAPTVLLGAMYRQLDTMLDEYIQARHEKAIEPSRYGQ